MTCNKDTDPAVTISVNDDDPSTVVYTASVTVDGVTYTDVKEESKDIIVIPYPANSFKENTDNKDITDDEEFSYTIRGHLVTVSCNLACKIGYLNENGDGYIPVLNIEKVKDNQYTFIVPDDIFEVILVVKGNTSLDDKKLSNYDVTLTKLYNLRPDDNPLTKEQIFAADASCSNPTTVITNYDVTLIKGAVLYIEKALPWMPL